MTHSQSDLRQYAPATERNRQPILDVLQQILPTKAEPTGTVLEVSSGTGEHSGTTIFLESANTL